MNSPQVSRFRILDKIGAGGMGIVYRAEDLTLKRMVGLKFLSAHVSGRRDLRDRFMREAQTAAALNHPNICTIYDVGEVPGGPGIDLEGAGPAISPGTPYIAMELVVGRTLKT